MGGGGGGGRDKERHREIGRDEDRQIYEGRLNINFIKQE